MQIAPLHVEKGRFVWTMVLLQSLLAFGFPLLAAPNSDSTARPPVDPVAAFKGFLESPPVIERLVYRKKLKPDLTRPFPLSVGLKNSTNHTWFELRWQPAHFFERELRDPGGVGSLSVPGQCWSFANDEAWIIDGGQLAVHYSLRPSGNTNDDADVSYQFDQRARAASEIINLGIPHLLPGSVKWSGNSLRAEGMADHKQIGIQGELAVSENGYPASLQLKLTHNQDVANYRFEYAYSNRLATPLLPSLIRSFFILTNREIEFNEWAILELATRDRPASREAFSVDSLVANNHIAVRYYTNNALYDLLPSGTLRLWQKFERAPSGGALREYRYFYFLLAGVTAALFALVVRVKLRETTTIKTNT